MESSFNLKDYERLLASLSHKALRRATAKGFYLEFDDLFQEAKQTFVVASEKFDPQLGVKFSTYLWSAVRNNLQRIESNVIKVQSKTKSMDAEIGDDVGTLHDLLASNEMSIADTLVSLETRSANFSKLSSEAQRVVAVLDSPTEQVIKELRRMEEFRAHCKANNFAAASRILDVQTVCVILGYSSKVTRQVKKELQSVTGAVEEDCELDEPCPECGSLFRCGICKMLDDFLMPFTSKETD